MEKGTKKIIILYFIFIAVKILLSFLISGPSVFGDEYVYSKLASSIHTSLEYTIHNIHVSTPVPLYPMLISLSYFFDDINLIYFVIKLINIIIISLTIFPFYFLARKFLETKEALIISFIAMLMPMMFNTNFYVMSENLYYPLFASFIYFLYCALNDNSLSKCIYSGIILGLMFLTRAISAFIIPAFLLTYIILRKKVKFTIVISHYLSALIIVVPWFLRNGIMYGFTPQGLLGFYSVAGQKAITTVTELLGPFINWIIIYLGYAIIATGFFFGTYYFLGFYIKENKYKTFFALSTVLLSLIIIAAANESASTRIFYDTIFKYFTRRPIGRYVDPAALILLLGGFITYVKLGFKKIKFLKASIISAIVLVISAQLTIAPLFPFNNQSLTLLGAINYAAHYALGISVEKFSILIFALFSLIFMIFIIVFNLESVAKKAVKITAAFFIITTIIAFSVSVKTLTIWAESEQLKLSKFIGENYPGANILFDEENCVEKVSREDYKAICQKDKRNSIIGYWINSNITVGSTKNLEDYDYILTSKKLDYKIIKDIKGELFFYSVEK